MCKISDNMLFYMHLNQRYVTQYWKTSLIAALLILRLCLCKVIAGVVGQKCLFALASFYLSFDTKIGPRTNSVPKLEAFFAVHCLYTEIK